MRGLNSFEDISIYKGFNLILISYYANDPLVVKFYQDKGLENLYSGIVDNPNVYFVPRKAHEGHYIQYMKEHYSMILEYKLIKTYYGLNLYKVISKK